MIIESGKYSSDKYLVGMLQTMEHNSKFLLRLVNQLMNFSKSEKGMLSLNLRYGNFSSFSKEVFQQFTYWSKQKGVGLEYSVSRSDYKFSVRLPSYGTDNFIICVECHKAYTCRRICIVYS